jgi:hypothetical protein
MTVGTPGTELSPTPLATDTDTDRRQAGRLGYALRQEVSRAER